MVEEWERNNQKKQTGKYQDPKKTKVSTMQHVPSGVGGLGSDGHQNASIEVVKCSNTKLKAMIYRGRKSKKTETNIIVSKNTN